MGIRKNEKGQVLRCRYCKSTNLDKAGFKVLVGEKRAKVQCQECGRTFYAGDADVVGARVSKRKAVKEVENVNNNEEKG